jgi:hypothetical protein
MKKINPRCDIRMYPKIPNVRFLFLWLQFLGGVVCFHPTIHDVQLDIVGDISMQQSPFGSIVFLPLVFWSGMELKENICVDG